ncbi:MAG: hypothetical protein NT103_06080 [Campylobacterales bacterium]|nr:hypothetical protein [Campylobacterales bacterium]
MLSDKKLKFLYNKKYDVILPHRACLKYTKLESIEDHEYTYRIAFEMLIRTKSFKKLFDVKIEDRGEKWISEAKALGLDTYVIKQEYRPSFGSLLYEASDSFTIGDIGEGGIDGLMKLVGYYYDKNKIYAINEKYSLQYTCTEEIDGNEVYINRQHYSIPCKDLNSRNNSIIMKPIDRDLRLRELEDDFLSTLTLKEIINFNAVVNSFWNKHPLVANLDEDDSLSRLINFYIKRDKIYEVKDHKAKELKYVKIQSPDSYSILSNHSNFYIPCRVKKNNTIVIEFKQLSLTIPLDEIDSSDLQLEEKFSAHIKLSEIDYLGNNKSSALKISDIQNGLNKLIQYYIDRNRIFPNEFINTRTKKIYKHCSVKKYFNDNHSPIQSIILGSNTYYIPCKKKDSSKNEIELKRISKNLSLKILEDCFVKTINKSDITNTELKISPTYTVPALKFDESTIINLPVNINLPPKELVAYIEKIKKDYDDKNTNLKHPIEIIGEELIRADKPKSIAELETNEMKKNIADIFYIHDILEVFLELKERIKKERKEEYDEKKLLKKIRRLAGFSKNKITIAKTYINYYIRDERYKELITGVSSKE